MRLWTVQYWLKRAGEQRLDRVDWGSRLPIAKHIRRTPENLENLILDVRKELKETSDLGEYGAEAIYRELKSRGIPEVPCTRTIGRILERRGVLDGRKRIRRPAPPRGWYLPDMATGRVELDLFDFIEDLYIYPRTHLDVLNGISLYGGLPLSAVTERGTAQMVVTALLEHWGENGLPRYAQFDNDTRFQGAHQHRDSISRVVRLCLSLEVIPVFVPPQETGFQAMIEGYNGRWQTKVWSRFRHISIAGLKERSNRYVAAYRNRHTQRLEAAPPRGAFPKGWDLDLQARPHGEIIFIRRTNDRGIVSMLGRSFPVDKNWLHRLVRCNVDLDGGRIEFYGLRRREPEAQPCLGHVVYELPHKRFWE